MQGPPAISVADARVEEGSGVTLDFVVSLSHAASGTVMVDAATSDATATVGDDYTPTSGTLNFAAGETPKTVAVPVFDDAHDEGEETLELTLSNATGAYIADAAVTGTIENSDPMPKAWLARFGRTVAGQVLDAVSARLEGDGTHIAVGGQRLGGLPGERPDAETETRAHLEHLSEWFRRGRVDREEDARTMGGRELLLGSSFHLASEGRDGSAASFAACLRNTYGGASRTVGPALACQCAT